MTNGEGLPTGRAVFVVDDDASVRKSLSGLLRAAGYYSEAFSSSEEFLERERYDGIGCIILDIRMPGLSGMGLQEELLRAECPLPIIFITGHGDVPTSVQAMKKGAVDFLPKPFDAQDLLLAIESALVKSKAMQSRRTELKDVKGLLSRLTTREYEVFRYVIGGMLNKQIAFKMDISEKTVKFHRGHVMEKLGAGSLADLMRLAQKAGISPLM